MPALAPKDASIVEASAAIAPFIIEQTGDVRRPLAPLEHSPDLRHLPGTGGWLQGLASASEWIRVGQDHILTQVKRYGPVYRGQLIGTPYVGVADPDAAAQIMRNADGAWSTALAWRGLSQGFAPPGMPLGAINMFDGEPHREIRQLLQPAFSASALESYLEAAIRRIEPEVDRWIAAGRVPFKAQIRRLLAGVASEIFLGSMGPAEAEFFDRAMADLWRFPFALVRNTWLSPTWRRAVRAGDALASRLESQVAERRSGNGRDLFSRLCNSPEELDWLDESLRVLLMISIMAAAFDSTSTGLTNMAYLLANDPEWQDRLRDHARAAHPGSSDSRSLRYQDLSQLHELDWAWKESLRMYPVASHLYRVTLRDTDVLGRRIPAGTLVFVLLTPMMADPKWWTEPNRFDPERFCPERAEDKRYKGIFLPFGAGAHSCIGAQLSTLEAKAFWQIFLSKARFRLRQPYRARHELKPIGIVSGEVELVVEPV